MDDAYDLRVVAARVADLGPAIALQGPVLANISAIVSSPQILDLVKEQLGSPDRAAAWLSDLESRARKAVTDNDGDHARLVGGLAALGSLVAEERPDQATAAFEAVELV
jgi:hypothetical protein